MHALSFVNLSQADIIHATLFAQKKEALCLLKAYGIMATAAYMYFVTLCELRVSDCFELCLGIEEARISTS